MINENAFTWLYRIQGKQHKSIKKRTKNFVGWARYVEVEPIKDLKNCLRSFFSRAGITLGVLFFHGYCSLLVLWQVFMLQPLEDRKLSGWGLEEEERIFRRLSFHQGYLTQIFDNQHWFLRMATFFNTPTQGETLRFET